METPVAHERAKTARAGDSCGLIRFKAVGVRLVFLILLYAQLPAVYGWFRELGEDIAKSRSVRDYQDRISYSETVMRWQSLSYKERFPSDPIHSFVFLRRSGERQKVGGQAALGSGSCVCGCDLNFGYQRRNRSSRSSLRTLVLVCSKRWAPRSVHCICCFLTNRLLTT